LILQMGEAHRQELSKIEVLIGKTFTNAQRRHGLALLAAADPLGMGRLTGSYIRLAIAHRACEESLAMTNRPVLAGTLRSLDPPPPPARPLPLARDRRAPPAGPLAPAPPPAPLHRLPARRVLGPDARQPGVDRAPARHHHRARLPDAPGVARPLRLVRRLGRG